MKKITQLCILLLIMTACSCSKKENFPIKEQAEDSVTIPTKEVDQAEVTVSPIPSSSDETIFFIKETITPIPTLSATPTPEPVYSTKWALSESKHYYGEWDITRTSSYVYDEEGRIKTLVLESLEAVERYEYLYNDNGASVAYKEYYYNDEDEPILFLEDTIALEFDSSGALLSKSSETTGIRHSYTYDLSGQLTTDTEFKSNEIISTRTFIYDSKGRLLKELLTDDSHSDAAVKIIHYDNNDLISVHFIENQFEECWRKTYKYDYHGIISSAIIYDYYRPDRQIGSEKYSYDEAGNLILTLRSDVDYEHTDRIEDTYSQISYRVS